MQEKIALATEQNRDELIEIWDECFGDEIPWRDWFFATRFDPQSTVCYLDRDGEIASDLQLYRYPMSLRGKIIEADSLLGVATRTKNRGMGYMGRILCHAMQLSYERGRLLMFHSPVRIMLYAKYGHLPSADIRLVTLKQSGEQTAVRVSREWDVSSMLEVYTAFGAKYSQMVARDRDLMALRIADSIAGGMELLMVRDQGGFPLAYAIIGKEKESYLAIECCYVSQRGLEDLLKACTDFAGETKIQLTLPPDAVVPPKYCAEDTQKPYFALRALDVSGLLAAMKLDSELVISVRDDILPHNNGCFDMRGNPSKKAPGVHMDASAFSQWICGYKSLSRLGTEEGQVTISDPVAVQRLDNLLPVMPCYLFERY